MALAVYENKGTAIINDKCITIINGQKISINIHHFTSQSTKKKIKGNKDPILRCVFNKTNRLQ